MQLEVTLLSVSDIVNFVNLMSNVDFSSLSISSQCCMDSNW